MPKNYIDCQCQWCLKDSDQTVRVAYATMDCSDLNVCPNCLDEVLNDTPGAKVRQPRTLSGGVGDP